MDFQEHTKPEKLIKYSFIWSEVRLLIASLALFLGGVPPILRLNLFVGLYEIIGTLLTLCWIISGLASGYLLYKWNEVGRTVFGKKDTVNTIAFFIMIISGFNLGLAGILKTNIGMSISSNYTLFIVVGVLYIISAWRLYVQWKGNGQKLL